MQLKVYRPVPHLLTRNKRLIPAKILATLWEYTVKNAIFHKYVNEALLKLKNLSLILYLSSLGREGLFMEEQSLRI